MEHNESAVKYLKAVKADAELDSEYNLLRMIVFSPSLLDGLTVRPEQFKLELHRKLYASILEKHGVDYEDMCKRLTENEIETCIYGIIANDDIVYDEESMLKFYGDAVIGAWKRRKAKSLTQEYMLNEIDAEQFSLGIAETMDAKAYEEKQTIDMNKVIESILDDRPDLEFGRFKKFSDCMSLKKSDFVTIGGTTGLGKSSFALNLLSDMLGRDDVKVQYFNLEMSTVGAVKRLISMMSDVPIRNIKENLMNEPVKRVLKILGDERFSMNTGSITVEELKSMAVANADDENTNVIIVDHLSILGCKDKNAAASEYTTVTYCTKELRKLALDHNYIVIALSQFDRASIKSKTIGINSFKSSGEIENSSTQLVILENTIPEDSKLYEIYYLNDLRRITLRIVKNRGGACKTFAYMLNLAKQKFTEIGDESEGKDYDNRVLERYGKH